MRVLDAPLTRTAVVLATALLTIAAAPLDSATQRCLGSYGETLRRVSLQANLTAQMCARAALRADSATSIDGCVAGDPRGAVAARAAQVAGVFAAGVCRGDEPLQVGAAPATGAQRQNALDLAHDLLGDPVGSVSGSSGEARCLDAGLRVAALDAAAIAGAHQRCLVRGLQSGAITDAGSFAAVCGSRAAVEAGDRAPAILARLADRVADACSGRDLAHVFDGLDPSCHVSTEALAACIERAAACRTCLALNATHGVARDCDAFDDGANNASCGGGDVPEGTLCTLSSDSRLLLASIGLPLTLPLSGALRVTCTNPGPDGVADCRCDLERRFALDGGTGNAIVIPAIGDVCVNPAPGCALGIVDCNGGSAVDADLAVDHHLSDCGSNAECAAACAAHCAGLGAGYSAAAACEGFCQGGAQADAACTRESQCPGGSCAGPEFGGHGGICNCACQGSRLGSDGGPGALTCNLGTQIAIELPSNGACGDAVVAGFPPLCVTLTSGRAPALIADANNAPGVTIDPLSLDTPTGSPIACDDLARYHATGLSLAGNLTLLDTTLGDVLLTTRLVCQ